MGTDDRNQIAGRVDAVLTVDAPGEWLALHHVARRARCTTHEARTALADLFAAGLVQSTDRGAWSRYAATVPRARPSAS